MSTEPENENFFIELGDIIKINRPENKDMDPSTFFIDYLDENQATLVNTESLNEIVLNIIDGQFADETIESIEILSKSTEKGYARQNGLLFGARISIQIGGDLPITINGQITNLEEDMIELTTYGDNKLIYIDFAYKGLPLNIPIENIRTFEPPKEPAEIPELSVISQETIAGATDGTGATEESVQEQTFEHGPPVADVSAQLKRVLLDADNVVFGEELEEITEYVPVKKEQQRFGIETQANDLLDDLLSTIPTAQRTPQILNKIHIMIERYKQLRNIFSKLTHDGIDKPDVKTAQYKPLVERLQKMDQKLHWLMPIVKNKKKLYDINFDAKDAFDIDFIPTTLAESQTNITDIINEYKRNLVPDGQNKYVYLNRNLNSIMSPNVAPTDKANVIIQKDAAANFTVLVDNLEDFYSTIAKNNNPHRHRFLLAGYDRGLTYLEHSDPKHVLESAKLTPLTRDDNMSITGFLTMPESALLYSHINLPNTSILMKTQLGQMTFNYFSILKKNTTIELVELHENEPAPTHSNRKYLTGLKAVKFVQAIDFNDRENNETYTTFLNKMIPKTRELFELIQKYIVERGEGVTYLKIIRYLEPFLIYPDDITFKQYETIVKFIETQILTLKRTLINQNIAVQKHINGKYGDIPQALSSPWFDFINILGDGVGASIEQVYSITQHESSAALINNMQSVDNMRFFSAAVALTDKDLYQPTDIERIIRQTQEKDIIGEDENEKKQNKCSNLVLAKHYIDIDALREDDDTNNVFFDDKYDITRYDINNEFKDAKDVMSNEEYIELMFVHLKDNVGLTESQAIIESEALARGKRRVVEDNYAYIEDIDGQTIYFKRTAQNTWKRNSELDNQHFNDGAMFCNIKKECLQIKGDCGTMSLNKDKIKSALTQEILNQFDLEFNMEYKNLMAELNNDFEYYKSNVPILKIIKLHKSLKNDLLFQTIGDALLDRNIVVSPHAELRDHILSQTDFVKKQANILTFVSKLCRNANIYAETPESAYWYYCPVTNTPLIPTYFNELAAAFQRGEYQSVLERVSAQRGEKSDDGEKIVDKYSGYIIKMIEYDTEEGFDETGYKIVSREVLEKSLGDILVDMSYKMPDSVKSKDAKMVNNVLNTFDKNMGISIEKEYDFIIKNVTDAIDYYIGTKSTYAVRLKKLRARGKRGVSYEKAHDETLMLFTMAYYLIAIQTMIPSVITRRTFPGCIRSFNGFPIDLNGDNSALLYIVCTALKLRNNVRPWSGLPRTTKKKELGITTKMVEKIKKNINIILENSIVEHKLQSKRDYLNTRVEETDIPEMFDVKHWNTFLPPLQPIKIKQIANISKNFLGVLIENIKVGSNNQQGQLNTLRGKMIAFSFHIQELIQRIINKEAPILRNLTDEPMLENACCNEGIRETLLYFMSKESGIKKYNQIVLNLTQIQERVRNYEIAPYIFSPLNTRLKYPTLTDKFSKEVMYQSFLRFCKYNIIFPDEIRILCESPILQSISPDNTIQEKINTLENNGLHISPMAFRHMLMAVNKSNIVDVNLHPVIISERHFLEIHIEALKNKKAPTICNPRILNVFSSLLDTFDIVTTNDSDSYNAMNIFLDENIERFQTDIMDFLDSAKIQPEKAQTFFDTMMVWKPRGENIYMTMEDETSITMYTFYNTFIKNIMKIYPNIIMKGVDYKDGGVDYEDEGVDYKDVKMPRNWKLSDKHVSDIRALIFAETGGLHKFYKDKDLFPVLQHIQTHSDDLINLMNATTLFADLILRDGVQRTILNGKILNKLIKFYMMCCFFMYINALNNNIEDIDNEDDENISPVLLGLTDNEGMPENIRSQNIREQIIEGERDKLNKKIGRLLETFINIMEGQKKKQNLNNEDIIKNVLKSKEKEKNKVTKNLGDLTVEEREIENILKNQRLGDWSLGQTRALYEYDVDQYDKERQEIEDDYLMELRLNMRDDVTDQNREIYKLEEIQEQFHREQMNAEILSAIADPDDDDYGEREGDEAY